MKKKQLIGLMACLTCIFLVTIAFQFFSLKRSSLGKHKYTISDNHLAMLSRQTSNKNSSILTTTILADMAAGPVAAAVEAAVMAGELTAITMLFIRSVSTAEEKVLEESRLANNITINSLD